MRYRNDVTPPPKVENPLTMLPGVWRSYVLLFNTSNAIANERLAELMVEDGINLSPRMGWVLMAAEERLLNQAQIAACLNINTNVMVRIVDHLQRKGLVVRDVLADRRSNKLEVTPKGKELLKKMYAGWDERTAKIFSPVPVSEVKHISKFARMIITEYYAQKKKGPARKQTL